ncbi:hypothetical protein Raf01_98030 [Rugosimonospora africana]|uniref:Uncharacterized protein n=2 Tax=Rugosimonospora africana TaxID=556532 RepID=A0A8J3R3K8_9ACTN|nr:hypothetical protein Raf01_98030 [Rugosimonospora africana]
MPNSRIATDLGTSAVTVGKWRKGFLQFRLGGLAEEDAQSARHR